MKMMEGGGSCIEGKRGEESEREGRIEYLGTTSQHDIQCGLYPILCLQKHKAETCEWNVQIRFLRENAL